MATIHKLTKDGATIFPATITDAVVHQDTGKTLTSMIKEYNVSELFPTEGIAGGNTYNLALAVQVLGTHLRASEKTGGIKLTFISSVSDCEEEYYLGKNTWSGNVGDWKQRFEVGDVVADPSGSWDPSTAEQYIDQQIGIEASTRLAQDTYIQSQIPLADEEDLTKSGSYLKFKDRTYNQVSSNGMGCIYLRKEDNFKTVIESVTQGNTIFVIRYDFILTGNVTVPANCVLEFDGGSISGNGTGKDTIIGNNTGINAGLTKIFSDVNLVNSGIKKFNAEWFGDIKTNFPQVYINKIESNIPEKSTLIINTDITVNQTTYIKKSINFEFKDIITTSSTSDIFVFGDSTHSINNIRFKAHYIHSIYDSSVTSYLTLTNSFIKVQSCIYSDFYFEMCDTIGYPIYFYPVSSCGQNRFSFNECYQGNCGITFSNGNATNWSEAYWCEGNQFWFGFIVRYNKGVDLHDCVKCKANLYSGAIDNVETDGYDIYDNSNKTDYYTKSLWLMSFYRINASVIDKYDTILDPAAGLFMAGGIYANGTIQSNNQVFAGTFFKVQANSAARLDLNDNSGDYQDYKSRIMLMGNGNLSLIGNKGRDHVFAYDYSIAPLSGTTTVSANATQSTINFTGGMQDNNYSINVSPHWNTTWWVVVKNTVGIIIEFGTAPSSDSEFDWTIYGKN